MLSCPNCGRRIPAHFLGSTVVRASPCPHCGKTIRLRRSKAFAIGYVGALVGSPLTTAIAAGSTNRVWTVLSGLQLFCGLALMAIAASCGFREEEPDIITLNLYYRPVNQVLAHCRIPRWIHEQCTWTG